MKRVALLLSVFIACGVGNAADDKTALCVLCHGTNVNGNEAVRAPKLAGIDGQYLNRQLDAFRSGVRGAHSLDVSGSEMGIVARSLKETEIRAALDFIAGQKSTKPPVTVQGNATRGATLFVACAACHGTHGEGNLSLSAPALSKGSDWYWVIQLNNFRNGLRGTRSDDLSGQSMRAASLALPDDQAVRDVVAHINTLK